MDVYINIVQCVMNDEM